MQFSQQSLDFLFENMIKDSKLWYNEHKDEYKSCVVAPFEDFIYRVQPAIDKIDSELICNPKKISRLYRDARYAKGKSIFRDAVWYSFRRGGELYEGVPGFFFEISPRGFSYGCGYYMASAKSMESLRELILTNDKSFQKTIKAYEAQNTFTLVGESYKRTHYPEQSERMRNWLDRKTLCLIRQSDDFDLLFSDRLADVVSNDFLSIAPIYHFMLKVESRV